MFFFSSIHEACQTFYFLGKLGQVEKVIKINKHQLKELDHAMVQQHKDIDLLSPCVTGV